MKHKLDCTVMSVPLPRQISWYWQTCPSPQNCTIHPDGWELVNQTDSAPVAFPKIKQIMSDDGKFYTSRLLLMENRVGWYKCVGENKIGTNTSVIQYVASGNLIYHHSCIDTYKHSCLRPYSDQIQISVLIMEFYAVQTAFQVHAQV